MFDWLILMAVGQEAVWLTQLKELMLNVDFFWDRQIWSGGKSPSILLRVNMGREMDFCKNPETSEKRNGILFKMLVINVFSLEDSQALEKLYWQIAKVVGAKRRLEILTPMHTCIFKGEEV